MPFEIRTTATGEGNALCTAAFADSYFADRAITAWAGNAAVKEAAIVRATDYIDGSFAVRYTDELLAMDTIPVRLARACAEYALRALTAALAPDPLVDPSGVSVVTVRKKLGPLEKTLQVVGNGIPAITRSYPDADMLIISFLKPVAPRVIR